MKCLPVLSSTKWSRGELPCRRIWPLLPFVLQAMQWPLDRDTERWLVSLGIWVALLMVSLWGVSWSLGQRRLVAFFSPRSRYSQTQGTMSHLAAALLLGLVCFIVASEATGAVRVLWYWLAH